MMLGPTPCQGCRRPVVWNGKRWRNLGQRSGGHACIPSHAVRCGAFMPHAKERCARYLGHNGNHSTRYAMDNATKARRKWAA